MPPLDRRQFSLGLLAAGLTVLHVSRPNAGPDWPSRTVRLIVPYPPGGFTDLVARLLAHELQAQLGGSFTVDNRPGANSIIGVDRLAKSRPDDHVFGIVAAAYATNTMLHPRLPYDLQQDLVPVSLIGTSPLVAAVPHHAPFASLPELLRYARRHPGKLNFGSGGRGSAAHLSTELLQSLTGTSMVHIPYRGSVPALADLVGGQIHLLLDAASGLLGSDLHGKVRLIGVASEQRLAALPGVPTFIEQGVPDFTASSWAGMLAPADSSLSVVQRMSVEVGRIVRTHEVSGHLEAAGTVPIGSTPEEFERFIADETAKWGRVIRDGRLRLE